MSLLSEKVRPEHLDRKAILYIRQSTSRQVIENQESRRLQYAMKDHLLSIGWREIDVVDEDLGKSAGGAVDRSGFDRMVAEVCLKKVGAVAARELSRFVSFRLRKFLRGSQGPPARIFSVLVNGDRELRKTCQEDFGRFPTHVFSVEASARSGLCPV